MPQNDDGMRIEPPPSVPRCSAPAPSAAAAAAPPEEPPGVRARSQGLRVIPVAVLSVSAFQPNSGVAVSPISTAPAARRRPTEGASSAASIPGTAVVPYRTVQPRT